MKPISIDTDLGTQVVMASGLRPQDRVMDNPPDSLANGDQVRVEGAAMRISAVLPACLLLSACNPGAGL